MLFEISESQIVSTQVLAPLQLALYETRHGLRLQTLCCAPTGLADECCEEIAVTTATAILAYPRKGGVAAELRHLLQPLPAFIWLDLDEDASADEAKAAFRKLSRKHHPDRGGSEAAWQLSGECMRLLRDDERIATYREGRNHAYYVKATAEWDAQGLLQQQRLAKMQAQQGYDEGRKTRKAQGAKHLSLEDKSSLPKLMPKVSVDQASSAVAFT